MSRPTEGTATILATGVALFASAAVIAAESALLGGAFLLVYGCFVGLVWGTVRIAGRWADSAQVPAGQWTDPYLLGYLAGGPSHAVHTVTIALIDRGLLRAEGDRLALGAPHAAGLAARPIEQAIVGEVKEARPARSVFSLLAARDTCSDMRAKLLEAGLLRRPGQALHCFLRGSVAAVVFLVVAVTRHVLGTSRGMHKFGLLTVIATAAVLLVLLVEGAFALAALSHSRTRAGDALLADMRRLFWTLPQRAGQIVPGGSTNDLSFLIALFGLRAAPAYVQPTLQAWNPPPPPPTYSVGPSDDSSSFDHSSTSSWDTSSCGSSSGCSSSSSDGGGGCGGCNHG